MNVFKLIKHKLLSFIKPGLNPNGNQDLNLVSIRILIESTRAKQVLKSIIIPRF